MDGLRMRVEHVDRLRFGRLQTVVFGALAGFGFAAGAAVAALLLYAGWRMGRGTAPRDL